jgi:MerR family transcriptional regulator, mercuric resistance operon regulatory protein
MSGMLPPARTQGGHRCYRDVDAGRLIFIRHARQMGFTIVDIRSLLSIHEPGRTSCAQVRQIAISRLQSPRERLYDLKRKACLLADAVSHCPEQTSSVCVFLEMLEAPTPDSGRSPKAPRPCAFNPR